MIRVLLGLAGVALALWDKVASPMDPPTGTRNQRFMNRVHPGESVLTNVCQSDEVSLTHPKKVAAHFSEEGKKEDVESGPEEEEVPTRGFLKRQANMIVDAKSRSKRGNRRR